MNCVIIMGRLTKDADVRVSQGGNESMSVARFTLAVDRKIKTEGGQNADFISCVAFGKKADFINKYVHKGTKIVVTGRIQTGSYTNKDGNKVYTTDVACDDIEFAESKNASAGNNDLPKANNGFSNAPNGLPISTDAPFMNIPEDIDLPFSEPTR